MKIDKRLFVVAVLLNLAVCLTGGRVLALTIEVDEFGNGIGTLGSAITNDPGPGGLPGVLTYFLPFAGAQGDVLLYDADFGTFLDVIRFNGDGTLIFYSDNVDGFDAPADTPSPPSAFYPNVAQVDETGTEAFNDAYYTPDAGQPGFDPSGVTYHFVSDGTVPEPDTMLLLSLGLVALGWRRHAHERSGSVPELQT